MKQKRVSFPTLAILFSLLLSGQPSSAWGVDPHTLHVSPAQGQRDLDAYAKTYSTRQQWQQRADRVRRGILQGAQLDPLPAKAPLNPIFRTPRKHEGYTVENVAFESVPGFFVTGNLYRPLQQDGKHPAILCPHGHFGGENGGGRFRPDHQIRCATLARMGAVVLAYDMVGWGESTQMQHQQGGALTMQTLNSMRAVDFLCSLPDVDPARIGITGASGGGTQTFLLSALDKRITASAPVVMVAANYYGGCRCESGLPIHKGEKHNTNNAEIAAISAPRPLLLVSCGADWTQHTPEIELPYIRNIYRFFGKENVVENAHFPDQQHDYNASKRAAVYAFLARHLNLDRSQVSDQNGNFNEEGIPIEPREMLHVFDKDHPRPDHALTGAEAVLNSLKTMQRDGKKATDNAKSQP